MTLKEKLLVAAVGITLVLAMVATGGWLTNGIGITLFDPQFILGILEVLKGIIGYLGGGIL